MQSIKADMPSGSSHNNPVRKTGKHQDRKVQIHKKKSLPVIMAENREIINAAKSIHLRSCKGKDIETPEQRYDAYIKENDYYHAVMLLIELIKSDVSLNKETVTPEMVLDTLHKIKNKTSFTFLKGLAELYLVCFDKRIKVRGSSITPEKLVESFIPINKRYPIILEHLYKKDCILNGTKVTLEKVYEAYKNAPSCIEKGKFLFNCFKQGHLKEKEITIESILENCKDPKKKHTLVAKIMFYCFKHKIQINNKTITADDAFDCIKNSSDPTEKIDFEIYCLKKYINIKGQLISPEKIMHEIDSNRKKIDFQKTLANFLEICYFCKIKIKGKNISELRIIEEFGKAGSHYKQIKFIINLLKKNQANENINIVYLIDLYKKINPSELNNEIKAMFFGFLFTNKQNFNSKPIDPNYVIDLLKHGETNQWLYADFMANCAKNNLSINGKKVTVQKAYDTFPSSPRGEDLKTDFLKDCYTMNIKGNERLLNHQNIIKRYKNSGNNVKLAFFLSHLIPQKIIGPYHFYSPDKVFHSFRDNAEENHQKSYFAFKCLINSIPIAISPDIPLQDFVANLLITNNMPNERARLMKFCFLSGIPLFGHHQKIEDIIEFYNSAKIDEVHLLRFLMSCCLKGFSLDNKAIDPNSLIQRASIIKGGSLYIDKFKAECLLAGFIDIKVEEIIDHFDQHPENTKVHAKILKSLFFSKHRQSITARDVIDKYKSANDDLNLACFMAKCCIDRIPVNNNLITYEEVLNFFPKNNYDASLKKYDFIFSYLLSGGKIKDNKYTFESIIDQCLKKKLYNSVTHFYSQLALNSIPINGKLVTQDFFIDYCKSHITYNNEEPILYFITRINQIERQDLISAGSPEQQEISNLVTTALSFIDKNMHIKTITTWRLECILYFAAFKYNLIIDGNVVTSSTMNKKLDEQPDSFLTYSNKILFLSYCIKNGITIDGYPSSYLQEKIDTLLNFFPINSRSYNLAHSLTTNSNVPKSSISDHKVIDHTAQLAISFDNSESEVNDDRVNSNQTSLISAETSFSLRNTLKTNQSATAQHQPEKSLIPEAHKIKNLTLSNPLYYEILTLITQFNKNSDIPKIIISGSFSRLLQNISDDFKDIDLIFANQSVIDEFLMLLRAALSQNMEHSDLQFSCYVSPEVEILNIPKTHFFKATEGILGEVVVDVNLNVANNEFQPSDISKVDIEDSGHVLHTLSLTSEVNYIIEGITYWKENLNTIIDQILDDPQLIIQRTILFNYAANDQERIYGLLVRCLLSLDVAIAISKSIEKKAIRNNDSKKTMLIFLLNSRISHVKKILQKNTYFKSMPEYLTSFIENNPNIYQQDRAKFILKLIDNVES